MTVSPDGENVYLTASADTHDAVAVFTRNTGTGALTQLGGLAACVSETGSSGTCTDVYGLDGPFSVVVSPDGKQVYGAATVTGGVAAFTRNQSTGALTQMSGTAGCISETGSGGLCVDGKGLWGARKLAISPDGETIYVVAEYIDAVGVISRDPFSGQLSQSGTASGCVSETAAGPCLDGNAMDGVYGVTVDPLGRFAYVAAWSSNSLLTFRRQG